MVKEKISSITNLATTTAVNTKINQVKDKIPNIINLAATTTAIPAVENKIPSVTNLVKKNLIITQKLMKLKRNFLIMIVINVLTLQN